VLLAPPKEKPVTAVGLALVVAPKVDTAPNALLVGCVVVFDGVEKLKGELVGAIAGFDWPNILEVLVAGFTAPKRPFEGAVVVVAAVAVLEFADVVVLVPPNVLAPPKLNDVLSPPLLAVGCDDADEAPNENGDACAAAG